MGFTPIRIEVIYKQRLEQMPEMMLRAELHEAENSDQGAALQQRMIRDELRSREAS